MTRWIHISDLQLGLGRDTGDRSDELAVELVRAVLQERPDFVVHSGDCIHGTSIDGQAGQNPEYDRIHEELWRMYRDTIAPLLDHCPILSVVGNHDHTFPDLRTDLFCRYNGRDGMSSFYSDTFDGVQVICLDVVPNRHCGGFASATVQESWLLEELAAPANARCRMVVGHYPMFMAADVSHCVDETLRFDEERGDPGRLLPLLLQHEVDLYLCGHMHIYERARYQNLTQVQAGASRMAYEGLLEMVPSRHLQAQDEHQSYVVFEIRENRIEARAIALGGDPIDSWVQPLNRPMANDRT